MGQTLEELEASAFAGDCALCCIRYAQLSDRDLLNISRRADIMHGYSESGDGFRNIGFLYPTLEPTNERFQKSVSFSEEDEMDFYAPSDLLSVEAMQKEGMPRSTNSLASLATIDRWLDDCLDNHTKCSSKLDQARQLPNRVVDLGCGDSITPIVCASADLEPEPYVALSHCWGQKEFLQLRQDNIAELRQQVPVAKLSTTSRDAMEVARRLDIRYIWIDSLCIVQDSPEDWHREASQMADIYSNALLTIAATSAKDGDGGLFHQRRLVDFAPCRVQPRWAAHPFKISICNRTEKWEDQVDKQHLLSRAWVVQERTLSARIVHFGAHQVYWECERTRASEAFPTNFPGTGTAKPTLLPDMIHPIGSWDPRERKIEWHNVWEAIVEEYSRADLTYTTKDKLVAISGIAKRMGLDPLTYVAGMWKQELRSQLLWTVREKPVDGSQPGRRAIEYRAPSWSWASIDGEVFPRHVMSHDVQRFAIRILEAVVEPEDGVRTFGRVKSGYIRVAGFVAAGRLSSWDFTQTTRKAIRDSERVNVPIALSAQVTETFWHIGRASFSPEPDGDDLEVDRLHYCLFFDKRKRQGLLIDPVSGQRGTYIRLGCFSLESIHEGESAIIDLCRTFDELADDDEALYEERGKLDSDGLHEYVLKLV